MLYVIFDDMSQCTPAQVECLLPLVSQQRREQALRYTHTFGQYTCLKSYCMLQELLQQWGKQTGREVPLCPKFNYNEYGAPSIDGGPFFSISHCKQAIAVVVSDAPVGIDIESIRPMNEGLVARTMDAIEQDAIFSSSNPEFSFARLWTRKEAYLKLKGTGIINDLRGVLTNTEHLSWHEINAASSMYVCTIVSE
jgi:4'-phosphopantetheinyl transferase